jgi:hypothetical protein
MTYRERDGRFRERATTLTLANRMVSSPMLSLPRNALSLVVIVGCLGFGCAAPTEDEGDREVVEESESELSDYRLGSYRCAAANPSQLSFTFAKTTLDRTVVRDMMYQGSAFAGPINTASFPPGRASSIYTVASDGPEFFSTRFVVKARFEVRPTAAAAGWRTAVTCKRALEPNAPKADRLKLAYESGDASKLVRVGPLSSSSPPPALAASLARIGAGRRSTYVRDHVTIYEWKFEGATAYDIWDRGSSGVQHQVFVDAAGTKIADRITDGARPYSWAL